MKKVDWTVLHSAICYQKVLGVFCGDAVWHLSGFPSSCTRSQINLFHLFDSCDDLGAGAHNTSSLQRGSVFTRWIRCYKRLERASFILHFIFCGSHSHTAWWPKSNLQIQTFKLVADVQFFFLSAFISSVCLFFFRNLTCSMECFPKVLDLFYVSAGERA